MLHSDLWDTSSLYSQINAANADNPGGHVIGNLYKVHKAVAGSAFSCLRHQNIGHKVGDTMLVLDIEVVDDPYGGNTPWKDVYVLINGKLGRFKIWAFTDLITTKSIKLVK